MGIRSLSLLSLEIWQINQCRNELDESGPVLQNTSNYTWKLAWIYRSWLLSKIFLKYGNVVKARKLVKRGSDSVTLSQIKWNWQCYQLIIDLNSGRLMSSLIKRMFSNCLPFPHFSLFLQHYHVPESFRWHGQPCTENYRVLHGKYLLLLL